jgi:hypothetical protein
MTISPCIYWYVLRKQLRIRWLAFKRGSTIEMSYHVTTKRRYSLRDARSTAVLHAARRVLVA